MRSNGRAFQVAFYDALAANDAVEAMGNSECFREQATN
ncbi:hypothetical protein BH20VER3_BH20VER3_19410 [soil metagenome]